jgi:hypothetical protein
MGTRGNGPSGGLFVGHDFGSGGLSAFGQILFENEHLLAVTIPDIYMVTDLS